MLVDKTIKVEKEVCDLGAELVSLVTRIKGGEGVLQVIGDELGKLNQLIADVRGVSGNINDSLNGVLRSVAIHGADLLCLLLNKKVEA